ncbi:MAG: hypothetical protein WC254_00915, partial [Candidatus Woesearchaeota archaeon]
MAISFQFILNQMWIATLFPVGLLQILPAITLIAIGWIVEVKYTSRITLFANAIALSTYFYQFQNLKVWIIYYINFVTILGIIAIISYILKEKLGIRKAGLPK